jgi:hypothetical protein
MNTSSIGSDVPLREQPVLVGGTGRSGSTIVGDLLDHHPDLTLTRPMEVRFITGHEGFADALHVHLADGRRKGRKASRTAVDRLTHRWYQRTETVGLHQSVTTAQLSDWSQEYLDTVEADPTAATRLLVHRIMEAIADRLGADRWIDTTPANARLADYVEPIYPHSKVVVVTRDGRDVAASFVSQTFGPDDVFEALTLWETRMLRSYRAIEASRPDRILVLPLMELVVTDRTGALARLCGFLDIPVAPDMVAWFDANVSPEQMHPGRWRSQFDPEVTARVDEQYSAACTRLIGHGIPIPA